MQENVKCTFQEKMEKNHILLKSAQHISDNMDPENLEDELRSLLVANNEIDVSIAVHSEHLAKKKKELSEIKTKKQELIINLQKKRNEALQELIMKANTDLKQKNETLAAIQRKCTVCQKAIKVTKATMAELELQERKVSINVPFWKELMNKLYIQEHFSCKLFFIVYYAIYNI